MNIKLLIAGKEIDAQISEEDARIIQPSESRFTRKPRGEGYFFIGQSGFDSHTEIGDVIDNCLFSVGNYFTSEKQVQDHVRAARLWQSIKIFRQEREGDAWKKSPTPSNPLFYIVFDTAIGELKAEIRDAYLDANVKFRKGETALAVIDEFYGELMWYFTEFEDD